MKTVLKINKVSPTVAERLISSEFLSVNMSQDEAFLRLRFYYQELPIWLSIPSIVLPIYLRDITCDGLIKLIESSPAILSAGMISEIFGVPSKHIEKLIKSMGLKRLRVPPSNLLYDIGGAFYTPSDTVSLLRRLGGDIGSGRVTVHDSNRHVKRVETGLDVVHPEGSAGVASAKQLYIAECQKLLNPEPAAQPLTYATLDYSRLDWRTVCSQPEFKHLRQLYACTNNEYLSEYLTAADSERTSKFLAELAEKASKHHKPSHNEANVAPAPVKKLDPPKQSSNQEKYKTPWEMMKAAPEQYRGNVDFLAVYNDWYSTGALNSVEEFAERGRKFAVEMKQYAHTGGNMYLDVKRTHLLHGAPTSLTEGKLFSNFREYMDDFQILFVEGSQKKYLEHEDSCVLCTTLREEGVVAVTSDNIAKFFELLGKRAVDPAIRLARLANP